MQTLEWAMHGDLVRAAIPIACGAYHHAWQIATSEVQRQALYMDPNWKDGRFPADAPPDKGLALARMIAMISYRTDISFTKKFGREKTDSGDYQMKSYLAYQGGKFLDRMDALSYKTITEVMDSHDVGRNRGSVKAALGSIKMPIHVIGIDSDVLYPLGEQHELMEHLPADSSSFTLVTSDNGHDGFLLEQDQIGDAITAFLDARQ
jgi:homoserine O-acetyltransferase